MRTKILVVDDEPALCELIETVLASAGMEVHTFCRSIDAVDVLKKEKYDAVFLDVRMPSPDGMELARQMRAGGYNLKTPVVMITGDADPSVLKKGFEAGANFFLFKPVDRRGLLRLVRATQGSIQNEKRRFQRIEVTWKVILEAHQRQLVGRTLDVSLNGMLVESSDTFAGGTRVNVSLYLPSGPPLETKATVVRAAGQRMGVLLDSLSINDSARLQEYLLPLILAEIEREDTDLLA